MERLLPDLAHACRRLARAPAFAIVAILTLALGIGANTAIFSIVETVLLRPLPDRDPERLLMLWRPGDKGDATWISGPEIQDYAADTATFAHVAAYTGTSANLTGGQEPERVIGAAVTTNLFAALGVAPFVGRVFSSADRASDILDQVVLSFGLWQRRFGARTDLIGQTIQVNGRARPVVAVMPQSFKLPPDFSEERPSELWIPLDPQSSAWTSSGDHSLLGFARLQPNVSPRRASEAMSV